MNERYDWTKDREGLLASVETLEALAAEIESGRRVDAPFRAERLREVAAQRRSMLARLEALHDRR